MRFGMIIGNGEDPRPVFTLGGLFPEWTRSKVYTRLKIEIPPAPNFWQCC